MTVKTILASALLGLAIGGAATAAPYRVGDYYEDAGAAACPASTTCTVTFNAVPSDLYLMVRHVECQITSVFPVRYVRFGSSSSIGGPNTRETFLRPNPYYASGSTAITSVNQDLHYLVSKLRLPQVVALVDQAVTSMSCKITGYLTKTGAAF